MIVLCLYNIPVLHTKVLPSIVNQFNIHLRQVLLKTSVIQILIRYHYPTECVPELYLPFCEGLTDFSGKETYVQNDGDSVIIENGKAYFNGDAKLKIPRFSGVEYGGTVVIKMK